ncbi:MAG: pyridoxamine 5'-phosphate oxidase family protein, partial [Phenylobacterium sp.]|nr:pyridoxamine 5'-phosphate oxidase family protein [Phenylobacterium sp.]MCA3725907.1 pyridoxamine 5'-phosphate oxidase family protein [Phenylobacterium sp.]
MAEFFDSLTEDHVAMIARQPVFFVATAAADGRINLSPKGLADTLKVL